MPVLLLGACVSTNAAVLDASVKLSPICDKGVIVYTDAGEVGIARAREAAVRRADEGDLDGAATMLREAACRLEPMAQGDASLAEMKEDLEAEAERCTQRVYEARDRKYNLARSMAEASLRGGYVGKVSRRPRRPPPEPAG